MTDFVLGRNHTHRSLFGHIINFEKNVPVYVPPVCHKEVAMIGALPDDGTEVSILDDEPKAAPALLPDERRDALIAAFQLLEERNNRTDFTGQGVPSVAGIKKIVDFEVDRKEIEPAWREYLEAKGSAE